MGFGEAAQKFTKFHICASTMLLAGTAVTLGIFALKGKIDDVDVEVSEQSPFCVRFRLEAVEVNISQDLLDVDVGIKDVSASLGSVQIDGSSSKANRPCNDTVGPFAEPDIDIWGWIIATWVAWMILAAVKVRGMRSSYKLETSVGGAWNFAIEMSLLVVNIVMNMLLAPILGMRAQDDNNTIFSEFSQSLLVVFVIIAIVLAPCWYCTYSCSMAAEEPEAAMWGSAQCGFALAMLPLGLLVGSSLVLVIVYLSQYGLGGLTIAVAFKLNLDFTLDVAMVGLLDMVTVMRFISTLMQAINVCKTVIVQLANKAD